MAFSKMGIDFARPLPKERLNVRFIIVAVYYFTKWVEVEPFANITEANTCKFI